MDIVVIISTLVVGFVIFLAVVAIGKRNALKADYTPTQAQPTTPPSQPEPQVAQAKKSAKSKAPKAPEQPNPALLGALRGHTDEVLDVAFTSNKKYLASASLDRTIRVWRLSDLTQTSHTRINVNLDHATALAFSDDSKVLAYATATTKEVVFEGIGVKEGKVEHKEMFRFKTQHKENITSIAFGRNNSFVMTAGSEQDTTISIWSVKGEQYASLNTNQLETHMAALSPNSSLLAVASKMGDVKLWECLAPKEKEKSGGGKPVEKLVPVMNLTSAHKRDVLSVCFSHDNTRLITCGVDGTFTVWKVDVGWKTGERAKMLHVGGPFPGYLLRRAVYIPAAPEKGSDQSSHPGYVALLAAKNALLFVDLQSSQLVGKIEPCHKESTAVIKISPDGSLVASSGSDKAIKLWNSTTFPLATV